MIEIYSKSLVRAIGKAFLMKCTGLEHQLTPIKMRLTSCISVVFSVLNSLSHLTTMLPVGRL